MERELTFHLRTNRGRGPFSYPALFVITVCLVREDDSCIADKSGEKEKKKDEGNEIYSYSEESLQKSYTWYGHLYFNRDDTYVKLTFMIYGVFYIRSVYNT